MGPTQSQIGEALARLGNYRVKRAQQYCNLVNDGIGGPLVLALGMRETWGRNIQGGAKMVAGKWVPLDPKLDGMKMDVGWTQINRGYHYVSLLKMPAVANGTWGPVVEGKNPVNSGYVPRFEEALAFTVTEMREAMAYAHDHHVENAERFAVAAHNAGSGGALRGYQDGNVDKFTAGGDYSAWVMAAKAEVKTWLTAHPNWTA